MPAAGVGTRRLEKKRDPRAIRGSAIGRSQQRTSYTTPGRYQVSQTHDVRLVRCHWKPVDTPVVDRHGREFAITTALSELPSASCIWASGHCWGSVEHLSTGWELGCSVAIWVKKDSSLIHYWNTTSQSSPRLCHAVDTAGHKK
uniref:Uncharacterized protein n=1 Tax=Hyaloperonospora arabidopsidis (strain Emoy2) TaxID=559515 RepID=M4BNN7_HYAAE